MAVRKKKTGKAAGAAKEKCFYCREMVVPNSGHDCWTTTEEKLTAGLPEDLKDAWERLREFGAGLGEQRIYASHRSIMFARKTCYFFVRPKKKYLEVVFFLPKTVRNAMVHKAQATSKTKVSHLVRIEHRDQVEAPLTDWLAQAFDYSAP